MFTLTQGINDKGEKDKARKQGIGLIVSGKYSAKSFEPTEKAFDFVTLLI